MDFGAVTERKRNRGKSDACQWKNTLRKVFLSIVLMNSLLVFFLLGMCHMRIETWKTLSKKKKICTYFLTIKTYQFQLKIGENANLLLVDPCYADSVKSYDRTQSARQTQVTKPLSHVTTTTTTTSLTFSCLPLTSPSHNDMCCSVNFSSRTS